MAARESLLKLIYSPANMAWMSIFGNSPCSIDNRNLFPSLADAENACQACGLTLRKRVGHIYDVVIGD